MFYYDLLSERTQQDVRAEEDDKSMAKRPTDSCTKSRMHLTNVLLQVVLPHWFRLSAAKVTASDTTREWVVKNMAATGVHPLGSIAFVLDEEGRI
jgi:hypothetical protein